MMRLRAAIALGFLVLMVRPADAQKASSGPWTGTITANIRSSESNFKYEAVMNCNLTVSSTRCTYAGTANYTGKDAYTITESATQEHLQVSVIKTNTGEWKLLVGAFSTRGTKTITANGKSMSGNDALIQATNWEVPLPALKDPNRTSGSWTNSSGYTITWDLGR